MQVKTLWVIALQHYEVNSILTIVQVILKCDCGNPENPMVDEAALAKGNRDG